MEIENKLTKKEARAVYADKEFYDTGKRGVTYKSGTFLIKERNADSDAPNTIKKEAIFTSLLSKHGLAPTFYYLDKKNEFMIRGFVEGIQMRVFLDKIDDYSKEEVENVFVTLLQKVRKLDLLQINKSELTRPHKDVLITKNNEPVLIDFERCARTRSPQNLNQYLQFLMKPYVKKKLLCKGFWVDDKELRMLGRKYKKKYEEKYYVQIKNFFSFS